MANDVSWDDRTFAQQRAKKVAVKIREFVRDRFTPGSLKSLSDLEQLAIAEVERAIVEELELKGKSFVDRIGRY